MAVIPSKGRAWRARIGVSLLALASLALQFGFQQSLARSLQQILFVISSIAAVGIFDHWVRLSDRASAKFKEAQIWTLLFCFAPGFALAGIVGALLSFDWAWASHFKEYHCMHHPEDHFFAVQIRSAPAPPVWIRALIGTFTLGCALHGVIWLGLIGFWEPSLVISCSGSLLLVFGMVICALPGSP